MIPADVVSQLQNSVSSARATVQQEQSLADKLSGLTAGQKVVAEIQGILPNGTYRAVIAQRNITLSLPFSAKSGDSLELLVTESDGKLSLAVLSNGADSAAEAKSVSTTLSQAGQLISNLYSDATNTAQGKSTTVPLNAGRPIIEAPPENANELAPALKQAIQQSGMFYESHQAEWVEGSRPKADLQHEPQGKLSNPTAFAEPPLATEKNEAAQAPVTRQTASSGETSTTTQTRESQAPRDLQQTPSASLATSTETSRTSAQLPAQTIAPQLQTLVQQQLEAMATQNFVWQGQVWPGQEMHWEINEDGARSGPQDESAPSWTTHLRMTLPNLGEIDARIQMTGNQITLSVSSGDETACSLMQSGTADLRNQLDAAGLSLISMGIDVLSQKESNGDA